MAKRKKSGEEGKKVRLKREETRGPYAKRNERSGTFVEGGTFPQVGHFKVARRRLPPLDSQM